MRVGVLGGTFDPIHIGHLSAAQDAAALARLDRVLFVPNHMPPHKANGCVSAVDDRVAMVDLAVADNTLFDVSLVELERPGPSFTLETLRELQGRLQGAHLVFLVGCDALSHLHTWHRPHDLLSEFELVVMERPTGHSIDWNALEGHFPGLGARLRVIPVAQLEVSSEGIRRRVAEGRPIRYLVPPAVAAYIERRGLYRLPG